VHHASINKTPTNYIPEESLINVVYDKNTILAIFSFRKCQEPVRRETTEVSSIEFINYRMPPLKQNGCTVCSQGIDQQKFVGLFSYSDWLSRCPRLKFE